ncbi:MAG TPA: cysteine desulfurase family protein [Mucilaginibacter sp.]|nr:cysteine desulfurase family protein [Mucilaginibacter sp.]
MKEVIYLDNNATTPIDPVVLDAMMPYLTSNFANANSTHQFGVDAYEAVKMARKQVADLIGAEVNEIIFTSGATEAINLAIKGVAESYSPRGRHIVTAQTEHHAVLDTCRYLETKGYEVTYMPVTKDGLIDPDIFKQSIRPDTILVCIMYVNNETGVIQPIRDFARLTHEAGALFMTDATQAVGKIPVDVLLDDIDLLCFSGHKFYAPKGIGGLFIKQRRPNKVKISALLHGGGHEKGLRSGTLNVPGIVALGKASEIAKKNMKTDAERIGKMRDFLESKLLTLDGTALNGNVNQRIYSTTNIRFSGIDSDALIMALSDPQSDEPMIAVSNGSACTSTSVEPSHVLTAMGLSEKDAFCCIRFSLSKYSSAEHMKTVIERVLKALFELRLLLSS